ncbi:MAG: hypothetical protein JO037_17085, partial [Actinobacteria bacterium]|nr:hypothetical protein [Actinomycetota bacterium]
MNVLTRMVAAMLRRSMALMPASRREWTEAVWAETAEIPPGWGQLSWLAGGVRLAVREAALARGLRYPVAFAAAAAGLAWSAWSGPPGDSAIARNRVEVTAIAVILGGLPWLIRRARGPAGGGGLTRLVRAGGYAAVLALVLTRTALQRVADAPPNNRTASAGAWIVEIIFLAVLTGYAAVILAYTARRSPVVPSALALGTAVGAALGIVAYALGPLGFPLRFTGRWPALAYDAAMGAGVLLALCAPVAAGRAAARRAGRSRPA